MSTPVEATPAALVNSGGIGERALLAAPAERTMVKSVCPYCGVGCGMILQVEAGRVTKVLGDKQHPANFGRLCTKGLTSAQVLTSSGRMDRAYMRQDRQSDQTPVSMNIALLETAKRLRAILEQHGPDAIAFYVSGQMSLEAQYLINKLAKGFVGTNNIDSNSRLCMSSAASGYQLSLGADGPPGSYQDFDKADVFFVAGANMADCHPILFLRLMDRIKSGAKLIVVDPRRNATAAKADLFLQIKPGTDLALLNGLLHLLVENGHTDPTFIDAFTEGWDAMPGFLKDYAPGRVAQITGIPEADIRKAAQWIGEAGNWMSCWTMGLNQSTHGTWHTNAICNLHLATGAICRTGSGPFSLTGQPNAMGGREVGYLSHGLPGQRTVTRQADRKFVEDIWQIAPGTIASEPGPDTVNMFKRMQSGSIKAVWVICTNPVATVPDRQNVIAGMKAAELVITQDAFLDTETNMFADIMLPGAVWAEASGVMINSERNLSLMNKAVEPPGDSLPDWEIIRRVACAMGFESAFSYASAAEIFDEIRQFWNPKTGYDIRGISYARLASGPVQWPCPPGSPDDRNPIRYLNTGVAQALEQRSDGSVPRLLFPTASGKAQFFARPALPPAELPDEAFPFILNTGRLAHQWHTMTKTGKVQTLNKLNPSSFLEIHPEDARRLGVAEMDRIEVRSRRGRAILPAAITARVLPGSCFAPFHWNDRFGDDLAINAVTHDATDAVSRQPEFKFCAVALTKVAVTQDPALLGHHGHDAVLAALTKAMDCACETQVLAQAQPSETSPADALATILSIEAVQMPTFNEAEMIFLAGFVAGLRTPGSRAGLPIIPDTAPITAPTRLWLDGVLAGIFSRAEVSPLDKADLAFKPILPAAPSSEQRSVTVLWASQTGNCETLAERLTAELKNLQVNVECLCMADFDFGDLGKSGKLILISSTYGDGDPPDNGKGFWDFLCDDNAPALGHLSYAVCALGDSSYDQFCNHGKNLDARLSVLGATRITGRVDCDSDYEATVAAWIIKISELAKRAGSKQLPPHRLQPSATLPKDIYGKNNPYNSKLISNVKLNGAAADKDTRFISMSLRDSGIYYDVGDAVGVWPSNCPMLVDEVLEAAGLRDDAMVTVDKAGHLPLRQALQDNLELTRPSPATLELIAERSPDPGLKRMLSNDHKDELKNWLWGKQLVDVLNAFPVKMAAQEFVAALKHMQPRLYSISSSPLAHPGEVHATVAAVRYGAQGRKGACSTFLADRANHCEIPIFIQHSSHFRLPADPATPIVMIGPGTGVAPFRAFLHERRAQGTTGRNWLFFGERHQATDFYYRDEFTSMQHDGLLTDLSLAFSRDQPEKIYVQHRLIERGPDLWAWLQDGAYIYVCGDAGNMAKDVEAALLTVIRQHGGFGADTAQDYLRSLVREKRYLRDVY